MLFFEWTAQGPSLRRPVPKEQGVALREVRFGYEECSKEVCDGIRLHLNRWEHLLALSG